MQYWLNNKYETGRKIYSCFGSASIAYCMFCLCQADLTFQAACSYFRLTSLYLLVFKILFIIVIRPWLLKRAIKLHKTAKLDSLYKCLLHGILTIWYHWIMNTSILKYKEISTIELPQITGLKFSKFQFFRIFLLI